MTTTEKLFLAVVIISFIISLILAINGTIKHDE